MGGIHITSCEAWLERTELIHEKLCPWEFWRRRQKRWGRKGTCVSNQHHQRGEKELHCFDYFPNRDLWEENKNLSCRLPSFAEKQKSGHHVLPSDWLILARLRLFFSLQLAVEPTKHGWCQVGGNVTRLQKILLRIYSRMKCSGMGRQTTQCNAGIFRFGAHRIW